MRRVKSKNTGPEMRVRRLAHALGFRYRLHAPDLPGRPDLVWSSPELCVKAEEAPRLRLGCLGDLLFLEE